MATGNCPFQDWAISVDLLEVRRNWEYGEVLASRGLLFDRQMAAIAYYPDGRLRPLNAAIAARLASGGMSAIGIYDLFEVDPELGLKYVEGLIAEGQGCTDERLETIRRMRKAGHSSSMIASRLGITVRQVQRLLKQGSDPDFGNSKSLW